ncbi:unannotated protein [freshwater metagenome]|uniref:Unannotated protein n=1 Tax=freshwater metagenome TaxID=449393 RepID=A0A6J7NUA2_9ZZZZ
MPEDTTKLTVLPDLTVTSLPGSCEITRSTAIVADGSVVTLGTRSASFNCVSASARVSPIRLGTATSAPPELLTNQNSRPPKANKSTTRMPINRAVFGFFSSSSSSTGSTAGTAAPTVVAGCMVVAIAAAAPPSATAASAASRSATVCSPPKKRPRSMRRSSAEA